MEKMRNIYMILVGSPKEIIRLGRYMNKQKDNIKIDLRDVGSAGVDSLRIRSDIGRV
jgi:hypothetical protein